MSYRIHRIEIERTGPEKSDEDIIAFGKLDIGADGIAGEFWLDLLPVEREALKALLDTVIARVNDALVRSAVQSTVRLETPAIAKSTTPKLRR